MRMFNKLIAQIVPHLPRNFVALFSKHYIAGEKIEDAVRVVKDLMQQQMCATIDVLGEEVKQEEQVFRAVKMYKLVLKTIESEKLDANISVKPTHMGLKIDKEFCYQNLRELVTEAAKFNNFVRIDMEDSSCTTDTLEIYQRLHSEFKNVGTVLQAYMRRTINDINCLLQEKPNIRICKGIYIESREIAFKDGYIVNRNFSYAVRKLLENGCYIGIATHDEKLVWEALRIIDELQLKREQYEFQMLLGVDPQLRRIIVNEGHRLRVYVPFGEEWFAYSTRRLKENPNVVGHVTKNILMRLFRRNNR